MIDGWSKISLSSLYRGFRIEICHLCESIFRITLLHLIKNSSLALIASAKSPTIVMAEREPHCLYSVDEVHGVNPTLFNSVCVATSRYGGFEVNCDIESLPQLNHSAKGRFLLLSAKRIQLESMIFHPALAIMSSEVLPTLSFNELQKHTSSSDCWIAVHSKIYDVTDFLNEHPGGSSSPSAYSPGRGNRSAYR